MTFLAPWAGWFLAGVPVIIALYLLKLQRRAMTVSTVMFWQRLMQESRRRSLFQRLRNLLSLLLHLLIFLLIVAALAKPTWGRFTSDGSSTVLIIDGRARMQALEAHGASRFELARREAERYARQATASEQIALLLAGGAEHVALGFSGDEKPLRAAIAHLAPSDAGGSLDDAIALADQLLQARSGKRRIVVITDRVRNDHVKETMASTQSVSESNARERGADAPVQFVPVGANCDNVAITRFATREHLASAETCEILLEVRNFAREPKKVDVELALDGVLIDVKPFALAAGETKTELFSEVPRPSAAARGWLTARLNATDALAVDDIAFAVIPHKEPARVLLVTKGNWFLEKLLAADHQIEFEVLAPDAFQLAMTPQFDVVICDNLVPQGFETASTAGNFFFLRSSPFAAGSEAIEQPLITDSDAQHPLLRLVNLRNVTILRASQMTQPPEENGWRWDAPLRSFDHPLLLAGSRRSGGNARAQRVVALGFDIAESDLPLRIAFPLLMSNALRWLSDRAPGADPSLRAGEPLLLAPGEQVAIEPQTQAGASSSAATTAKTRAVFVPSRNGFYLRTSGAADERWIAVNTFDPAESDLRQERAALPGAPVFAALRALPRMDGRPPWQYLTLAAIALFALEWWLFHRRRTE